MMRFVDSLAAWGTPDFNEVLKRDIAGLDVALLPLQQGLSQSSFTHGENRTVMILNASDAADVIRAKAGIFYTGIIPGCSCADDPTPMNEITEYCEVQIEIDKTTANVSIKLLSA